MAVDSDTQAPPGAIRGAVQDTWQSLRSVFVNPALRRMELALAASMIGDWAFATAVTVYAYDAGGATLVGVWFAVRLILMAIVAPLASSLADRLRRRSERVAVRFNLIAFAGFCRFRPLAHLFPSRRQEACSHLAHLQLLCGVDFVVEM